MYVRLKPISLANPAKFHFSKQNKNNAKCSQLILSLFRFHFMCDSCMECQMHNQNSKKKTKIQLGKRHEDIKPEKKESIYYSMQTTIAK